MSPAAFDPVQYKIDQRRQWGESASGWQQLWHRFEQAAQHVNERLVELPIFNPDIGCWTLPLLLASRPSLPHAVSGQLGM